MFLKNLVLKNFRSFGEACFEFSPSLNTFYGSNAQGKTSIIEAIHFLITGRSFRTLQHSDLIKDGESFFMIEALFNKNGIDQKLKIFYSAKEKKIFYNQTACPSFISILGVLKGVTMVPEDLELIKGSPQDRRNFLDIQLLQADPLYVHHLQRYMKAMRQRNALLKLKNRQAIEIWETEMASSGAYVTAKRSHILEALKKPVNQFYREISTENADLQLAYKSTFKAPVASLKDAFLHLFKKNREREFDWGTTIEGPHKDDVIIKLEQKEAKFFASEGQKRSAVIALRMAEWLQLQEKTGESPLVLIDDIGINLDQGRRSQLFSHLETFKQVFTTTTERPSFATHGQSDHFLIKIEKEG